MPVRADGRSSPNALRSFRIERDVPGAAPGRVLVSTGRTTVLCTASVAEEVPPWMKGEGKGWVTAEYNMLPGSTTPRKRRDRSGKVDGRTSEIQRLIGRSLRAVVDLTALGERMITVDCDVLEADGGTRTASITGGFVALVEALRSLVDVDQAASTPLRDTVAAVSVGLVDGVALLDLDYSEDVRAAVDMNVVMTGSGMFVEVQGSGEEATFSGEELTALIQVARQGIAELSLLQQEALGCSWPMPKSATA
ncbi:MAG: ribonuclease PH [Pirellulales bacterium]|nr:ribonuclease PH [Pirellulales bacterium]